VTGGSAVCAQAAAHGNPWTSRNHRRTCSQHHPPRTSGRSSRFGADRSTGPVRLADRDAGHRAPRTGVSFSTGGGCGSATTGWSAPRSPTWPSAWMSRAANTPWAAGSKTASYRHRSRMHGSPNAGLRIVHIIPSVAVVHRHRTGPDAAVHNTWRLPRERGTAIRHRL
jgi:hypothetical protein